MSTKLDMDKIAKGLGAKRRGSVAATGGYFGALQIVADIEARFRVPAGGGRPTDPRWTERRLIPLAPRRNSPLPLRVWATSAPESPGTICPRSAFGLTRAERVGYNMAHIERQNRKEPTMPANAVVRARVDEKVKEEAAAILGAAGLTISDAFRMMLVRTVAERALPFDPLMPNEETIEAMRVARRGELVTVGTVDDLVADLHEDD
jgi:DNA-damage-inducible protein J